MKLKRASHWGPRSFGGPNYDKGIPPEDWSVTTTVPSTGLQLAQAKDGVKDRLIDSRVHLAGHHLCRFRQQIEQSRHSPGWKYNIELSHGLLTYDSRFDYAEICRWGGSPAIDPNFLATEVERYVMCEGWRLLSRYMFETP